MSNPTDTSNTGLAPRPGRPQKFTARLNMWGWLASLFLAAFGAKLWLIQRFGTPLPFFDQWKAEATQIYVPWLEGRLKLSDLFAAHNEHRIVLTNLYNMLLLKINGQWDGQMQMVINALIHVSGLVCFGGLIIRFVGRSFYWLVALVLAAALIPPFAWENTLAGIQSCFYFQLFLSLFTIWMLGGNPPWSKRWWLGAGAGALSLFSLASGFFAPLAVCAVVMLKILKSPAVWKQHLPTLAFGFLATIAGGLLKVEVPAHEVLKAHSAMEFLVALGKNLSWPWVVFPGLCVFNWLPFILFAWRYYRAKESRSPLEELTLGIGGWTLLQAAATAFARGAGGNHPGWRYMDSTSFTMIVNTLSIIILIEHYPGEFRWWKWLKAGFAMWGVACLLGVILLTQRAWEIDIPERQFLYHVQLRNARAFMATDDFAVIKDKPPLQLPLFDPKWLADLLRNPRLREVLPACVRPPLKVLPAATGGAFITNGVSLARPEPATEFSWGSYSAAGVAATGSFESQPLPKSRLPYLEFEIAGALGEPGLSLELIDLENQKITPVRASADTGEAWKTVQVPAPEHPFKLVARDDSGTRWFAFKEPRETGWLSHRAAQILGAGVPMFFAGLALFLGLLGYSFAARWRAIDAPDK